jgi:IclR family acetate operon transcriptional repressor
MLSVLEEVAKNQPIGTAEVARILDADKSGVQRSLLTLADAGWLAPVPGPGSRWRLTGHIQVIAKHARENDDLRLIAKPAMERLRDECGETVLLVVPDIRRFVVIEVCECRHLVRTSPRVGLVIPAENTATARIILPYLQPDDVFAMLGHEPSASDLEMFEITRKQGYAVNVASHTHTQEGREAIGSTNIGAPVFDYDCSPIAALVVSGPNDRLTSDRCAEVGKLVASAAKEISAVTPTVI